MRPALPVRRLLTALAVAVMSGGTAVAGETLDGSGAQPELRADPCGFYRGQAYGRGLDHFSTEMLWACEAIAARRSAGMALSDTLVAVEFALERYRAAVIAEGNAAFVRDRAGRPRSAALGAGDAVKATLAERSGALAALEAVRSTY